MYPSYPEDAMPVQAAGPGASHARIRHWKSTAVVAAGVALALSLTLYRPAPIHPPVFVSPVIFSTTGPASVLGSDIIALCREGRADEALQVADRDLAVIDPNTVDAGRLRFLRAGALRLLGREADARADYALAAKWASDAIPGEDETDLRAQSGDFANARRLAAATLESEADDDCAVNNACWELAMIPGGNPAQAVRLMQPILQRSHDPYYMDTLAWSLYINGDQQGAIAEEMNAIRTAEAGMQDSRFFRACLAGMNGDRQDAARALRGLFQENITLTDCWTAAARFTTDH